MEGDPRDVSGAHTWREKLGYMFARPGWSHEDEGRGLAHDTAPAEPARAPAAPVAG